LAGAQSVEDSHLLNAYCSWKSGRPDSAIALNGRETDIVVQRGTRYAGIEVKAAPLNEGDFRGLTRLREILGTQRLLAVALNASRARGVRPAAARYSEQK